MKNRLQNIVLASIILGMHGTFCPSCMPNPTGIIYSYFTAACRAIGLISEITPEEQAKREEWKAPVRNIESSIRGAFVYEGREMYYTIGTIHYSHFDEEKLRMCLIFMSRTYESVKQKIEDEARDESKAESMIEAEKKEEIKQFTNQLFSENPGKIRLGGLIRNFMYACSDRSAASDEDFQRSRKGFSKYRRHHVPTMYSECSNLMRRSPDGQQLVDLFEELKRSSVEYNK